MFCLLTAFVTLLHIITRSEALLSNQIPTRDGRIFPFIFPLYRVGRPAAVTPIPCESSDKLSGTCFTNAKCEANGGTPQGACAGSKAVCCVVQKSCGETTSYEVSYFKTPKNAIPERCTLKVNKINPNICQLRLDFMDFELTEPVNGHCSEVFNLDVNNNQLPRICGQNKGLHVYLDFDYSCDYHTFGMLGLSQISQWTIKITQIACNSPYRAPKGCLMYFNSTQGTVSSFNYGKINEMGITKQIAGLHYGVCVNPVSGYCSITWNTKKINMLNSNDDECNGAYILIHNNNGATDRFCKTLSSQDEIITISSPYVLKVETEDTFGNTSQALKDELKGTEGYQINFKQNVCSSKMKK